MKNTRSFLFASIAGILLTSGTLVNAAIRGPYTADANTLHLWHLNETALNVEDTPTVTTPLPLTSLGAGVGGMLGVSSRTGYGNAYSGVPVLDTGVFALPPANSAADNIPMASFMGADGAFTYELLVRIDFDAAASPDFDASFIMAENESTGGGGRTFQFLMGKFSGVWNMYFTTISPIIEAPISDPITVEQGHWYHAAVTYNGIENTAGNIKFYWTDMGTDATPNTSITAAAPVATSMFIQNDLVSTNSSDFSIGAEARSSGGNTGQWLGLIDEVRISSVARAANEFLFGVPGDFDGDGDVDGADFVAWQTNFPKATGATLAQGDADSDGDVDGADFVVWQTNFPFPPASGVASVPEPAAVVLFGSLLPAALIVARRRVSGALMPPVL